MDSWQSGQAQGDEAQRPQMLRRLSALVQAELAARFATIEWLLLVMLVALPAAFMWHFASPSFFFWDDLADFYSAHNSGAVWSFAFTPEFGEHLSPARRVTYLVLDRVAPMNFEVALGFLIACHAVSAVLLQRILTLVFDRAWWTYGLALAWAISVVYLPPFTWFAAGAHSIAGISATLASIHGYLSWQATGRRAWVVWSLVAMVIGLGFYEKAALIPVYLVLIRTLLLEPAVPLLKSLRSLQDDWRVWLAYVTVAASFALVYSLGSYARPESGATMAEILRYLGVFWLEGFSPMVFGVRVPEGGQSDLHQLTIVVAQLTLIGLVAWSVARRRAAWRAWAFVLVTVLANALMVVGRVSQFGAEFVAFYVYYYTEPLLLLTLAIAFAFAKPRLRTGGETLKPAVPAEPAAAAQGTTFKVPKARTGAAALVAMAAYAGVTWASADDLSNHAGLTPEKRAAQAGRFTRAYLANLRADIATARSRGVQPALLDHDVPDPVVSQTANFRRAAVEGYHRHTALSSVVPLFDEQVTFNQPHRLYIVRGNGRLQRTRFVPATGGAPAELWRAGRLGLHDVKVEHNRGEWCLVAQGRSALEWRVRPHLRGREWWLRVRYRTDPVEPFWLEAKAGKGWANLGPKLPPMASTGTAIVALGPGIPTSTGVRLGVPPFGRLCLRSLEVGSFDPPAPSPEVSGLLLPFGPPTE